MLGRFEEAVLVALINAKGEATTADVYEALEDKLERISFGAIYTTLDRMLGKKFVEVRRGEPLPERGGKARNYYRITSGGRAAVIEAQRLGRELGPVPLLAMLLLLEGSTHV